MKYHNKPLTINQCMEIKYKKVRALRIGQRFKFLGAGDVELIGTAGIKRSYHFRDMEIDDKPGTYSIRCEETVELVDSKKCMQ